MKKVLVITLVAVALSVGDLAAQEKNSTTTYIIDGQKVENFDGTQLTGKIITGYTVDSEKNTHAISTTLLTSDKEVVWKINTNDKITNTDNPSLAGLSTNINDIDGNAQIMNASRAVYVIDGKVGSLQDLVNLGPANIRSVTVAKNKDSETYKQYAKNGEGMVIVVTTK
ncbi:MAG: hypothetical protein ACI35T_01390 [Alistipes sp.]